MTHSRHNSSRTLRRGIASLEFVLCAVPLVTLAAMTISLGYCMLAKLDAAHSVRRDVWQSREQPAQLDSVRQQRLSPLARPELGEINKPPLTRSTSNHLPILRGPFTAVSRNPVLTGTWDWREVPEIDNGDLSELKLITEMCQIDVSALDQFAQLVTGALLSQFSDAAQKAFNQMQQAKQKMQQQVDSLIQQRDQMQKDRDDIQHELDHLNLLEKWKAAYLVPERDLLDFKIGKANDAIAKAEDAIRNLP